MNLWGSQHYPLNGAGPCPSEESFWSNTCFTSLWEISVGCIGRMLFRNGDSSIPWSPLKNIANVSANKHPSVTWSVIRNLSACYKLATWLHNPLFLCRWVYKPFGFLDVLAEIWSSSRFHSSVFYSYDKIALSFIPFKVGIISGELIVKPSDVLVNSVSFEFVSDQSLWFLLFGRFKEGAR